MPNPALSDDDYRHILEFRTALRRFLRYSRDQATALGLTPTQHQLLLAIRGRGGNPTVREVSESLLIRHHSAVELIDRATAAGLVHRVQDERDQRVVRVRLTGEGTEKLERISYANLQELQRLGPDFLSAWKAMERLD